MAVGQTVTANYYLARGAPAAYIQSEFMTIDIPYLTKKCVWDVQKQELKKWNSGSIAKRYRPSVKRPEDATVAPPLRGPNRLEQ